MRLTIYGRPGCHLCDEMKDVVLRLAAQRPYVQLEEIDISSDAVLTERYGLEIPVLLIDGRKVAKYRVAEDDLERLIARRLPGPGSAAGR